MACRLFGAKPLYEPMLVYSQLSPYEHISATFEQKYNCFHWRKWVWQCRMQNGDHFVLGLNVLHRTKISVFLQYNYNISTANPKYYQYQNKSDDNYWKNVEIVLVLRLLMPQMPFHSTPLKRVRKSFISIWVSLCVGNYVQSNIFSCFYKSHSQRLYTKYNSFVEKPHIYFTRDICCRY